MRTKLIATIFAAGCVLAAPVASLAQGLNEHPPISTPSDAQKAQQKGQTDVDRAQVPSASHPGGERGN